MQWQASLSRSQILHHRCKLENLRKYGDEIEILGLTKTLGLRVRFGPKANPLPKIQFRPRAGGHNAHAVF